MSAFQPKTAVIIIIVAVAVTLAVVLWMQP
jgi:hypothetical protein